ncbi:MAG: hypothetical protein A3F74_08250 [Betaproteobacteria bacterium RIFCSPLOWO2_12_FULL_62_58]|nr:MAG: hypothetical protein A3F74_08250 [Betaproteobacteria bacterium RIFCSPLOWO2_12_FULL_62_58]
MKRGLGQHVNFPVQQILQVHQQRSEIEKRAPMLQFDQKIDVALRTSIATRHRPKDAYAHRAVLTRDPKNGFTPAFKQAVH